MVHKATDCKDPRVPKEYFRLVSRSLQTGRQYDQLDTTNNIKI